MNWNEVPTFAVRETASLGIRGDTSGAPLKPLRDDSALRILSSLRGLRGAPEVPPLCRETSVSRTANVGYHFPIDLEPNGCAKTVLNVMKYCHELVP